MTKRKTDANAASVDWLDQYRLKFLKTLHDQGYAPATVRTYDGAATMLCRVVSRRGLQNGQLVGQAFSKARTTALASMHANKHHHKKYCLERFIDALVETGVAERSTSKKVQLSQLERLRSEYVAYLRDQRGLAEATIYQCVCFLNRFMAFRFGDTLGNLNDITPQNIVDFLRKVRSFGKAPRDKTPPSHLRSLFRFLFWSGNTKRDLAASIPRVAAPPRSTLPRYLKPEEVQTLLDAVWSADPIGRRNYAMLMILARLGLRAPEAIAIRLDDIDWRAGTILIRGKGKRYDRMPLPEDVGNAIVDYIRKGRRGASRTLFVSNKAPYRPFADSQILNSALKEAFERTGLKPPQKYVGSHLLRHSLATDMLRKGASLDEIGDVLRHRSRMTTTIYARHDVDGLRSIAMDWPAAKAVSRRAQGARA